MDLFRLLPVSRALLDDPAFSPDPRSHPHCSLADDGPSYSLPQPHNPQTRRHALKPVQTNIPRRARMKAFVRRLAIRHNLDRIDELDETDPFGGSYHHDGPYEAISTGNIAQPANPGTTRHRLKRESDPHPWRSSPYQPALRVPPTHDEPGLSLHLEPGQVLQQNTIYTSHAYASVLPPFPGQFRLQQDTVPVNTRSIPTRRQSLPNPPTSPLQVSSPLVDSQNSPPSFLRTPRKRHTGEHTPNIPNRPPLHQGHHSAPYVLHQSERTVLPPPRYESRLHSLAPSRSPQCTPSPSFNVSPPKLSIESAAHVLLHHDRLGPRHRSAHSLDGSHTAISTMSTPSTKFLDPPRIRHFPKRLVMPAPLQPQPSQPQYKFPPAAEAPTWRDGYADDATSEGTHSEGMPVQHSQESSARLLRKRSSAFPTKTPIPDHIPMSQDDTAPVVGNSSTKTANEARRTKERTRRRKLSKRKGDIDI